nr:hypothetical protein CFP56_25792 [Quercus suber]
MLEDHAVCSTTVGDWKVMDQHELGVQHPAGLHMHDHDRRATSEDSHRSWCHQITTSPKSAPHASKNLSDRGFNYLCLPESDIIVVVLARSTFLT